MNKNKISPVLVTIDCLLALIFIFGVVYVYEIRTNTDQNVVFSAISGTSTSTQQAIEPLSLLYAVTPAQQQLGLGNRTSLPSDEGMLFVFPVPGNYAFWMKDMHFSIDMIWMDQDFKITHIAQNVSPDTYPASFYPNQLSSYVLETNAGYSQNNNLSVGETLDFVKNSLQNRQ